MMDKYTDLQIVPLVGLQQGQFMTVAITGVTHGGHCVLEFKNGSDTAWSVDPSFKGTISGGILVERVKCLSASSRIRFSADPADAPYWISLVWDAVPTF
jgi:hypothetical protein